MNLHQLSIMNVKKKWINQLKYLDINNIPENSPFTFGDNGVEEMAEPFNWNGRLWTRPFREFNQYKGEGLAYVFSLTRVVVGVISYIECSVSFWNQLYFKLMFIQLQKICFKVHRKYIQKHCLKANVKLSLYRIFNCPIECTRENSSFKSHGTIMLHV